MEICNCGDPKTEHHPSFHYAQKRDALMVKVEEFMDRVYPVWMMGESFDRKQTALVAACFILDNNLGEVG